MRDLRSVTWCWQSLEAVELIHAEYEKKKGRAQILALYQGLTYLASKRYKDAEPDGGFAASREQVCLVSGLSAGSVHTYAKELQRIGLLEKRERIVNGRTLAPVWALIDPGVSGGDSLSRNGENLTATRAGETVLPSKKKEPSMSLDGLAAWKHYAEKRWPGTERDPEPTAVKLIENALKARPLDAVIKAIDGCWASTHHQGENEQGRKYQDLSHILAAKRGKRSVGEQIDFMGEYADAKPKRTDDAVQSAVQTSRDWNATVEGAPE